MEEKELLQKGFYFVYPPQLENDKFYTIILKNGNQVDNVKYWAFGREFIGEGDLRFQKKDVYLFKIK
jgi:hypothetical protein